jgi:4-hydroxy-tetrahydrodipicolinate synthase
MLKGVLPILLIPFDRAGKLDQESLKRVLHFELEGGAHGIGINGFASEAYKLTDGERNYAVEVVAHELAGQVPLIIGLAPGSTEAAIEQMRGFAVYNPACYMVLPPATMNNGSRALIEHYVALAEASDTAIMVQQSPHIAAYGHCLLAAEELAEISAGAGATCYYKLEGPGAPERMKALRSVIDSPKVGLFGGVGGITFLDELQIGASGVIPGVGFNEVFLQAWQAWEAGDSPEVERLLRFYQPLVNAVSSRGHEFSLHARKHLLKRAGLINTSYVRRPTVTVSEADMLTVFAVADSYHLRISQPKGFLDKA